MTSVATANHITLTSTNSSFRASDDFAPNVQWLKSPPAISEPYLALVEEQLQQHTSQ